MQPTYMHTYVYMYIHICLYMMRLNTYANLSNPRPHSELASAARPVSDGLLHLQTGTRELGMGREAPKLRGGLLDAMPHRSRGEGIGSKKANVGTHRLLEGRPGG